MIEISLAFGVSVFIAGILMFLAPCTFPLIPAYLAFISGVKNEDLKDPQKEAAAKRSIVLNGLAFVVGFSFIFTLFGMLAGFLGGQLAAYQDLLTKIGGAFIVLFGLMMIGVIKIDYLLQEHKMSVPAFLTPGQPTSAFIIGSTFAIGWTPCVGPVLASVLLLASTQSTALEGGVMLAIFSVGLAIPFLLTAFLYARVVQTVSHISMIIKGVSIIGGLFLILIGILLFTGNFGLTIEYGYQWFDFLNYDALLDYL